MAMHRHRVNGIFLVFSSLIKSRRYRLVQVGSLSASLSTFRYRKNPQHIPLPAWIWYLVRPDALSNFPSELYSHMSWTHVTRCSLLTTLSYEFKNISLGKQKNSSGLTWCRVYEAVEPAITSNRFRTWLVCFCVGMEMIGRRARWLGQCRSTYAPAELSIDWRTVAFQNPEVWTRPAQSVRRWRSSPARSRPLPLPLPLSQRQPGARRRQGMG